MASSATLSEDNSCLSLAGDWSNGGPLDLETTLARFTASEGLFRVDLSAIQSVDGRVSALLLRLQRIAERDSAKFELIGGPESMERMLALASAVPLHKPPVSQPVFWLNPDRLRKSLEDVGDSFLDSLAFLGAAISALARSVSGRGSMRRREFFASCVQSGPNALGIIALTSLLVGMILAYLGAAQLQQFGAAVYVADLVAVGMLREMGALMTAVVMAGRTGAAYAAQLSTMQAGEEIDAISTLGIDPMEFLVAPRILALVLMMPVLVIFSDALGIVGGALVAGSMGVTPLQYIAQLQSAVSLSHFGVGFAKAILFAALIAVAGCRAGMTAGRNSAAVGRATTDAVVTSVVYLIIADAGVNILCQQLGV